MKLVDQKIFNKKIEKDFDYKFFTEEDGVYLIEIIASAKSWQQNLIKFISFFKDDNLAVKIDETEFSKLNGKRGLFDGEVAWNGNNLKGFSKTGVFVMPLSKGEHIIHFLTKQSPVLKSIKISQVEEAQKVTYIPTENNPAEDGNRRQWMSFVVVGIKLQKLNIQARANNYKGEDDDDIRLVINGEIQKNITEKAHKYWYWCGRVLKGQEKEFNKKLELEKGMHYLELWADRKPFVHKVEIGTEIKNIDNKDVPGKRIPTVDDPEWTEDWNDDSERMILARTIYGEARGKEWSDQLRVAIAWSAKNRIKTAHWGNDYHSVVLADLQYSCFNEKDPNLPFVKDPLSDDKEAWENCYKIAGQVMNDELEDPTDGANHYFSEFIDFPEWTKSPQAEFKIKIDNTLFYDLNWMRNGFVKLLLIFSVAVIFFFGGVYYKTCVYENKTDTLSGVWATEHHNHFFINPKTEEINKIEFDENGKFLRTKEITSDGYPKIQLKKFSDNRNTLGYFQYLHKRDAPRDEDYYNNHIALMIMKDEYSEPYEIYSGDYHTSEWKLGRLNNKTAVVYYNCGSPCMYAYEINIETGEAEKEYYVYE